MRKELDLEDYIIRPNDRVINGKYIRAKDYDNALAEGKCPLCGAELTHSGGCAFCPECGWTACDN